MMSSRWIIATVVLIGLVAGYFQENVKIAINFTLDCAQYAGWDSQSIAGRSQQLEAFRVNRPSDYYYNHNPIESLAHLTVGQLKALKWAFSLLLIAFYWILTWIGLRKSYKGKFPVRVLHYGYVGLLVLCATIFAFGKFFQIAPAYDVAREILGWLQSVVPLLLLVLGYSIYLRFNLK